MTNKDFYHYLKAMNCEFTPVEHGNPKMRVESPKSTECIYLNLPLNDYPAGAYFVCHSCSKLKLPLPDFCKVAEGLTNHLKSKFYPDK